MTEEELADIALLIRSEYEQDTFSEEAFNGFRNILLTMAAMADERDHLRAENERLGRALDRCECERCFSCDDPIPVGNAIYYDANGDPFCSRCWAKRKSEIGT